MRWCALLLASFSVAHGQEAANKTKGLEFPAQIEWSGQSHVLVVPKFPDGNAPIDMKWIVLAGEGSTKAPEYTPVKLGNAFVLIVSPHDGETLVYGIALYGGKEPWMTDPALTYIRKIGPPTKPDTEPTPEADKLPAGLQIHMLFDLNKAEREIAQITQSPYLEKTLAASKSTFFPSDWRAPIVSQANLTKYVSKGGQPSIQLPAVVIVRGGKPPVILPLTLTGDARKTEQAILTAIAKAVKP